MMLSSLKLLNEWPHPNLSLKREQTSPLEGEGIEPYLDWEDIDFLWWNNYLWAGLFQEDLENEDKIKVAILDTGIDYNHLDLDDNYNLGLSYNFVNEDNDTMDDNWHGTQVTWIIWAEVDWTWVYWINSNSDLISLKVLDADWLGTSYDILESIDYAKQNEIRILNMSFGWIWNPETSGHNLKKGGFVLKNHKKTR